MLHHSPHHNGHAPVPRRWRRITVSAMAALTCLLAVAPTPVDATNRPATPARLPEMQVAALRGDAATAVSLLRLLQGAPSAEVRTELNRLRDKLANQAATAVGAPAAQMRRAWASTDDRHLLALLAGITQIGVPYRSMRSDPGRGFDCSGFTTYAWGQAGLRLARQSGAQIRAAEPRNLFTARAGDLAYYPGHVMLYLGLDNFILHAPYSGQVVSFDSTSWHGGRLRFGDPTA